MPALVSIHGRSLGYEIDGKALVSNGIQITRPCVDATVTATPGSGATTIAIQLKDADGKDINYVETVDLILFTSSAKTAFAATGGSTGLAIGTDGAYSRIAASKIHGRATSEADGDIDLTYTDNVQEATWLGVRLPNGRIVGATITTTA